MHSLSGEMSGWIGKPGQNSRQHLLTGRHSKLLFFGTTQMLEIQNLLWQSSTNLLRNIPAGAFCPSLNLHPLIGSSDRLPIVYWPQTVFFDLKFRRHTPKASIWNFVSLFTFTLQPKGCHLSQESLTLLNKSEMQQNIFSKAVTHILRVPAEHLGCKTLSHQRPLNHWTISATSQMASQRSTGQSTNIWCACSSHLWFRCLLQPQSLLPQIRKFTSQTIGAIR